MTFVSSSEAEESLPLIKTYCAELLGVNVDLSGVKEGGAYYFKAEKSDQKKDEYKNMVQRESGFVRVQGSSSVLSTLNLEDGDDEEDLEYSYLIFIFHASSLRKLSVK